MACLSTTRLYTAIILSHYRRVYSAEYSAFHIFLHVFFPVYLLFNFQYCSRHKWVYQASEILPVHGEAYGGATRLPGVMTCDIQREASCRTRGKPA
jgi:hypothetical protein